MLKWLAIGSLVSLCFRSSVTASEEHGPVEAPKPLVVRLVDQDRKPVAEAHLGLSAYRNLGNGGSSLGAAEGTDWHFYLHGVSDAGGTVVFPVDCELMQHLCFVAFHPGRCLAAIEPAGALCRAKTVSMEMRPACHVSGRLSCPALEQRGRAVGWSNVYLKLGTSRAAGCTSEQQTFEFFVPPGQYTLDAYGAKLHHVEQELTVRPGQRALDLGAIELPATELALLEGRTAPELEGVLAWKNSSPLKLADLRGKVVLLEFWGYWCGPCVYRMPELFAVYDSYRNEGLEVVGVHVDDNSVGPPVDSAEKLDELLAPLRAELWQGCDLPFPVALVRHDPVAFSQGGSREARCALAARYGIKSYPTAILIGRDGKVIGRITPGYGSYKEELKEALSQK